MEAKVLVAAERRLAEAYPFAKPILPKDEIAPFDTAGNPFSLVSDAADAFRAAQTKFGRSRRALLGLACCEMIHCDYRDAVKHFSMAGSAEVGEVLRRKRIVNGLGRFTKGRILFGLEPIPGTRDEWLCLLAKADAGTDVPSNQSIEDYRRVLLLKIRVRGGTIRAVLAQRVPVSADSNPLHDGSIIFAPLDRRTRAVVVYLGHSAGDCEPTTQIVYRIARGSLTEVWKCWGVWNTLLLRSSRRHLVLGVANHWKMCWWDMYEWNGRTFKFANRQNPQLFHLYFPSWGVSSKDNYSFPSWSIRASLLGIRGRFREALQAWRRAEGACKLAVSFCECYSGLERYSAPYSGDLHENLREVQQRIKWLKEGDQRHYLLCRPYDWDLQVRPYRLGLPTSTPPAVPTNSQPRPTVGHKQSRPTSQSMRGSF
ncbi:MAG TPA: hypothetical protein VG944_24825 [Fimbriimonas sp.]|nr:hypothetical protein [Fimbriimonas sp.]